MWKVWIFFTILATPYLIKASDPDVVETPEETELADEGNFFQVFKKWIFHDFFFKSKENG